MVKSDKGVIVRFYRFHNRLREKVAGLGVKPGEASVSLEALEKAEEAMQKMSEDYPDWVSSLLATLSEHHGRCVDTPEERNDHFEEINHVAHDMKGQGGTFGYPLISAFSDSLYNFTVGKHLRTDNEVEIVRSHVDAMRAVIKGRVSGDGGKIGVELTKGLNAAIKKYAE